MKKVRLILLVVLACTLLLSTAAVNAQDVEYEKFGAFSYEYDFEEGADDIAGADLMEIFYWEGLAGGAGAITENGTLKINGYAQLHVMADLCKTDFVEAYTYTFDFKSTLKEDEGIFIRGIAPQSYTIANPKNGTDGQVFNYYEWDWYVENGGTNGKSSSGGSGIKIFESEDAINITIKCYVEDGLNIMGHSVALPLPEGFKVGELNQYKIEDNNMGTIVISVNGVKLCTIEYSGDPEAYPDGNNQDATTLYYPKAVVKDATGAEVLSVEKPRICAEYAMLAFGIRAPDRVIELDNLVLECYELKPVTDATEPPAATEVPPTEAPATQAPAVTEAPKATQAPEEESGGCGSSMAIAQMMTILAVAIVLKKKK